MAIACGEGFTTVVTEQGDIWAFGRGDHGKLGIGTDVYQVRDSV